MICICPDCLKGVDVEMDKLIISAEQAKKILGKDISEVRAYCEHCEKFITIKLPKDTELKVVLC